MITYTDKFGNPVRERQIALLKEYNINTFYDTTGLLKIKESVKLKKRKIVSKLFEYYIDSKENKEHIIKLYTSEINDYSLMVYSELESSFQYKIWDRETYSNKGILISKNKIVYDDQNRWILNINLESETHEIPLPSKRYYGIPGLILEFTYRNKGNNEYAVQVKNVKFTDQLQLWSQNEFIEKFGFDFWDEHPYYHSLYPLLPSTSEV